jgi:hypothetical protein
VACPPSSIVGVVKLALWWIGRNQEWDELGPIYELSAIFWRVRSSQIMPALLFGAISLLYATVGQAAGTGFLALMALAWFPPSEMRPTALMLTFAPQRPFHLCRSNADVHAVTSGGCYQTQFGGTIHQGCHW